jgi:ribosomal protein S10
MFANVIDDDQYLGVSWTVICANSTPVSSGSIDTYCGTFGSTNSNTAQTASGPIPLYLPTGTGIITAYNAPSALPKGETEETVTITAHATSLPSATSSVTLTICGQGGCPTQVAAQSGIEPLMRGRNTLQAQAASLTEASPASGVTGLTQGSEL